MITSANKLSKIQDALTTRLRRYPRAAVFPYPFTDYLTILTGEPCCISSVAGDGKRLPFSTNPDELKIPATSDSQWSSATGDVRISARLLVGNVTRSREDALQELLNRLFEDEGEEVVRYFGNCLLTREPLSVQETPPYLAKDDLVKIAHNRLLERLRSFSQLMQERYSPHELSVSSGDSLIRDVTVHVVKPGTNDLMVLDAGPQQNGSAVAVEIATAYRTGLVQWFHDCSGIAVPLHVHGAPWLVVAYKPSSGDIWQSCYAFYREFVPELGDALRTWVRTTLIDELTSILRGAIRSEASTGETANALATGFHVLARCLPSPEIRIPSVDNAEEIAQLDCGRAGVFTASISTRNDYHPKHLEPFGSASPVEVRNLLESMSRSIAAEEFQRSWTHASLTSHLLGSPIAELRGCLLFCTCDRVERARAILNEMDGYRKALRSAVVKETALDFTGAKEEFIELVRQHFPTVQVRGSLCAAPLRSSSQYLKLVAAVCLDNFREHGCGELLDVSISLRADTLWMEIANSFPRDQMERVVDTLPDMRQGNTDQLGIQTLHLCADRWFSHDPDFNVTSDQGDADPLFHVILPIAVYED